MGLNPYSPTNNPTPYLPKSAQQTISSTRKHSSRMRTARLLSVGVPSLGRGAVLGDDVLGRSRPQVLSITRSDIMTPPPPVNIMTD